MKKETKRKEMGFHGGLPDKPMHLVYKPDPIKNAKKVFGAELNPMPAKYRMTTYDKVNSADY